MIAGRKMAQLALVGLVGLIATSLNAQQGPRYTLSEATARALRGPMGKEPFAALADWAQSAYDEDDPAWRSLREEQPDQYYELLFAALWSDNPNTSYAAACLLPESCLDIANIDRWLQAVKPHVFDEHPRYEWDTLKHVMSTEDVTWMLTDPPSWHAEIRYHFLSDLHRSMRPEHIPQLAKLTQHQDPFVRKHALHQLGWLTVYTDQYRELIARTLLALPNTGFAEVIYQEERSQNPPYQPRSYTLPTAREGWSPLLRAAMEHLFLQIKPSKNEPPYASFLARWAEDELPAEEDRLLIRSLLDSSNQTAIWIALRALCRIGADEHLRQVLEQPPAMAPEALVLAARGDLPALRELASDNAEALGTALEFDFDGVWLPWVAEAFGEDAQKGLEAMARLSSAYERRYAHHKEPPQLMARLRQAIDIFGAKLDFARLHQLVENFPAARSDRLISLYWDQITPANLTESATDVLEVSWQIDFVGRLVEWAKLPNPEQSGPALDLLLRLGCDHVTDLVLAHWKKHHADDPFLLARNPKSVLFSDFLEDHLRQMPWGEHSELTAEHCDALGAVAMLRGMPEGVAREWAHRMDLDKDASAARNRERFPTWSGQVLDHAENKALVDYLSASPARDLWFQDLGTIDDDVIRDLLHKTRNAPGANVQWAIGELALSGDSDARRELDEMRFRHLYGWFDNASAQVLTLGHSLDLVPYLIGEVETICCRRNGAASAIDQLTDFDVNDQPEQALVTQHDYAQQWWQECGDALRWSVLKERFVVAAH
jgi:hypothetical protein